MRILRLHDLVSRWSGVAGQAQARLGTGLVGKMLAVAGVAALLTVVLATMAWLSFQQVVTSHEKIVNEAIPAMESVQNLVHGNSRLAAWLEQLQRLPSAAENQQISTSVQARFLDMDAVLAQLGQQHFARDQSAPMRTTLLALEANFQRQIEHALRQVDTGQREGQTLARQRAAIDALLRLSEFLVANASATTTANIANLYRLIDGQRPQGQLLDTLDRLIEVDVDAMERMSELQLLCANLKTALDQLQATQQLASVTAIEARFAAGLTTLKRRIDDLRDPSLRQNSLAHYRVLASADAATPFDLHRQHLAQAAALQQLGSEGRALLSQFNQQASALATAGGHAIDSARTRSQRAVDRVLVGFLLVAALFCVGLIATLWAVFRHHVVGRLKGMETAVRALSTGNYEVSLATSAQDPLAPLSRALEQVRDNVRARERLEQQLRQHQEALENQVAQRTAELKHTNALLAHEAAEHALARQQAEDANNAKNVFLGSLSHELRTPLSGVSGVVRLLQDTPLDAQQRDYLRLIEHANRTLLEIFEDMLGFSRIEAGKLELQPETFNLRETLDAMLSLQSVPAEGKGLALRGAVSPAVPQLLVGDRRKLNQLLLNLIGNAIKFTDQGSVTVSVDAQDSADPRRKRLDIAVSDTGIGIPATQCAEVFKPFFQVEDTAHRRHGGTGLGLAICQRLVQAMGGEISLSSEPGRGTCVRFSLELEVAEAPGTDAAPRPHPTTPALRALTVLVVEDDAINRLICVRYLELLGHRSLVAEQGEAALALMQQQGASVDAVLMDISLPGQSGLEVAQAIHALDYGRWARLPVVVMSAHLAAQTQAAQKEAGLAGFLSKPFTLDDLARVLAEVTPANPGGAANPGSAADPNSAANPASVAPAAPGPLALPDAAPAADWLDAQFLADELDTLGAPMLQELLTLFHGSLPATLDQMTGALQAGQWPVLAKLAHRLRSSAANLGLRQLITDTRDLELAAKAEAPETQHLQALFIQLKQHAERSCQALAQHLLTPSVPGTAPPKMDP